MFKSVRAFIGAKNFEESKQFYLDLGFSYVDLDSMLYFSIHDNLGFYLQKAYVKDWVDNSMLFLEVENLTEYYKEIKAKNLDKKYEKVRLSKIVKNDWGQEFFLHDPSGILWHIGNFKN
ncbi:glyoxalase [Polaribacter sp. MED152]|uniref:glyoxalase n=1 Tax=Polaribacter sp. MED152 TaxID=313598 RepID=UPI000068CC0A|nr:glyoxalase [Polaribacter sp. MED152]EAQ41540.1 hypothetical protein MED152_02460 [Polaribacter sp. MED152]